VDGHRQRFAGYLVLKSHYSQMYLPRLLRFENLSVDVLLCSFVVSYGFVQ